MWVLTSPELLQLCSTMEVGELGGSGRVGSGGVTNVEPACFTPPPKAPCCV